MKKYVLLLRGINVGGKNKITMKELKDILQTFPVTEIETYIQSGNVVLTSNEELNDDFQNKVAKAISRVKGFEPRVFVIESNKFLTALTNNPFAEANEKDLHFYFLNNNPIRADLDSFEKIKQSTEDYNLTDAVFYLYAPEGIGRSKLATNVERHLKVPVTARNWRTVKKIQELLEAKVLANKS